MGEVRLNDNSYDEKGRLNKIFVEAIAIPKNEGYVEGIPDTPSYKSEEFMLASKFDELNGGFQLKLQFFQSDAAFPSLPYITWRIKDSLGNEDTIRSITELASNQAFLDYSHVYWVLGYLIYSRIGLKIYELHDQGWVSIFDYEVPTILNHIGMNNQPISSGGEVKQFFASRGEWNKQAEAVPLLFRCAPASYRITNNKGAVTIDNDFVGGAETFSLSDRKLSSSDSPFNDSAVNMGYGAFEMDSSNVQWSQYGGSAADYKLLLFAPYIKRHTPQMFKTKDQRDLGSISSADVLWDGYEEANDNIQEIGKGCFAKTKEARVTDDPVQEQEPGLKLDGEKKITIIGFYKPEVHWTELDANKYTDGHPLSANPCGLHPSGFPKSVYTNPANTYNPYAPQYYLVNSTTQSRANIGVDFQDYPSFVTDIGGEAYDITTFGDSGQYTKNEGFYRVLFNASNNTGIIGGEDAHTNSLYSTYDLNGNFVLGGNWLGRFDLELWEQVRSASSANNISFLNDLFRIAQDQSIFGARRFLVKTSAIKGPYSNDNYFNCAAWPFERIRFGKMFRCAHSASQFNPWLGQRNATLLNNSIPAASTGEDGWINNTVNGADGLEGFPFLQFFRRPPVSGLMTALITDMVPPYYPSGSGPFDYLGGTIPSGAYYDFKKTALAPSLCVVLRAKFNGAGVIDKGWPQLQSLHSYDPEINNHIESPEVDNVYQVMQLTSLPYHKLAIEDPNSDKHHNVWHIYVASLDLENQKAFIGCAPVPQYDHNIDNYTDQTGWDNQLAIMRLGLDVNSAGTYLCGPDRFIQANVYKYATEYDFGICQPVNHPEPGDARRRLLIASKAAVKAGLCIHAPTGPEETDEIKAPDQDGNSIENIPILDPKYNYSTNAPTQLDTANNRIEDDVFTARFNILGSDYNVTTFNSLGSCRNGHDNMVFKGKIGEHLIVPGLYTNSDGTDAVKFTDLLKELQFGQVPPNNWQKIAPDDRMSVCAVDAIRIHKQEIVNVNGNLKPNVCPANFKVLGPQPHYDLDAEHVKLSEKVEIIKFKPDETVIE